MNARRFRNRIQDCVLRRPLFGEEVDAVADNSKSLAVKISGVARTWREIRLVGVGKPNRVNHRVVGMQRRLQDAQKMEVGPIAGAVVAHVAEIDVKVVVVAVLDILERDARKVQLLNDMSIGGVDLIQTLVAVVVVGKEHVVEKHQAGSTIQRFWQCLGKIRRYHSLRVGATAVINRGIRIIIECPWVGAAAFLRTSFRRAKTKHQANECPDHLAVK